MHVDCTEECADVCVCVRQTQKKVRYLIMLRLQNGGGVHTICIIRV